MPGPKLALTTLTAVLALTVLALPRPGVDPEIVERRLVAMRRLAVLDEQVRLVRMLIAGGAWDTNTAFNVLQLERNRLSALKEISGVTPRLILEHEQVFHLACLLFGRTTARVFRASDMCQTESQLWHLARELTELQAQNGLPPGDEGAILKQMSQAAEAARRPAPDDGSARRSLMALISHE